MSTLAKLESRSKWLFRMSFLLIKFLFSTRRDFWSKNGSEYTLRTIEKTILNFQSLSGVKVI